MATIRPFAALRPKPELASQVCELPYDVMSSEEAAEMAEGNPLSFLHVSKPEIDLPAGTDVYSDTVYAKGAENLQKLIADGVLFQDEKPCYYLYRQIMKGHSQTGLVAVSSCEEYDQNIVKKHEFTRPQKEDDRVRHIEALNSQTGPVFLTYPAIAAMDAFVQRKTAETPSVDLTAKDGVQHTAWIVNDPADIEFITAEFAKIPNTYIADGHHRSAAASRVNKSRSGAGQSPWFLTVIFPHNQMQILAYNRALKDLNGRTPAELLTTLEDIFEITPGGAPVPGAKHSLGLFLDGKWFGLKFKPHLTATDDPFESLDVSLLQKHVLQPLFGIDDPRTSDSIAFIGGIRGTDELERVVNNGDFACAFSMFPTSIEDLMAIADQDGVMPPKSTWFEPKLRDAMFCHML
jgi:uncharacterized protein (DUF1015 family)